MNSNKTVISFISLIFISLSFLITQNPRAEEQEVDGEARIKFQANYQTINPVDPNEEDDLEIIPTHPPTDGPLSINYASNINFGKHQNSETSQVFYADLDEIKQVKSGKTHKVANFVQITDYRGTATGWTLNVKQNHPFMNEEGTVLNGAKLIISAESITSQDGMTQIPTGLKKNQNLSENGSFYSEIVRAEEGTGVGRWNIFIGSEKEKNKNAQLEVPKNEPKKSGKYTTTLTWLLQDAL